MTIATPLFSNPLFSNENSLDLWDVSTAPPEDDRTDTEIISSVKSSPGKSDPITWNFPPIWARMLMLIILESKTTCNQAPSCSWTFNEAISTISKMGFSSGSDFCRKHQATVICSCLSFTPNCYPASLCQLGLNEIMKILLNIPLKSIWGECAGDKLEKWNGIYAFCVIVSIVNLFHMLRWILMRNNCRFYMISHSARDSPTFWHLAKSIRKQKATRHARKAVARLGLFAYFSLHRNWKSLV